MSKARKPLPGCPSRHAMVYAAISMESVGYDWQEYDIIPRLCMSSKAIRQYILPFVKNTLDMWDGLKPKKGMYNYEIAYVAAFRLFCDLRRKINNEKLADELASKPFPKWTQEQYSEALESYLKQHKRTGNVTTALKESLERETCAFYGDTHTAPSGCEIIPFSAMTARNAEAWNG